MKRVTENIFVETGVRGCNPGFVVTSEGVVLIETPQELDYTKTWAAEISKWGKVRYIINTEHHFDHWFNNSFFEGDVISQEIARDEMLAINHDFIRKRAAINLIDPFPIPEGHQLRRPNITYSERMTIYLGKHTFQLIHTPGHTVGETSVYIPEEKVVFSGDNVFGEKRTAIHSAVLDKWLESLNVLEKLDVRFIVPGHGKVVDKGYLKRQASIIRGLMETSQKVVGADVDRAIREKIDPFFPTRDIGLNPKA